jgi:hypothetical protein
MCEVLLDTSVEIGGDGTYHRVSVDSVDILGFSCRIVNHGTHYQGMIECDLEDKMSQSTLMSNLGHIWGTDGERGIASSTFECNGRNSDLLLPFHVFETKYSNASLVAKRKDVCPQGETSSGCYNRLYAETMTRDRDALDWFRLRFFAQFDQQLRAGECTHKSYKGRGFVMAEILRVCQILRGKPPGIRKKPLKERLKLRLKAIINRVHLSVGT